MELFNCDEGRCKLFENKWSISSFIFVLYYFDGEIIWLTGYFEDIALVLLDEDFAYGL